MPDDPQTFNLEISTQRGRVLLNFPHLIHWIAFSPEDARHLAEVLVDKARQASAVRHVLQEHEILRS